MRLTPVRAVGIALVAVLAAGTLSACRTNVGTAAVIDGHTVSESDVSSYLTAKAAPVAVGSGAKTAPRVFVLDVLILEPYFRKIIDASPIGYVSDRKLAAIHDRQLAGKSDAAVAAEIGVTGYSTKFDKMVVDLSILAQARNQLEQAGKLAAIEAKLTYPVRLNPRYGTWSRNDKNLFIDASPSAGLPNFLTLQSAASGS